MVKKSLLIIMIVCIFILAGCRNDVQTNNSIQENNDVVIENNDVAIENKEPIYYFYKNRFMGSLENGIWYSPLGKLNENLNVKEWEYSKLLDEKYYVYGNNIISNTNKVGVSLEPGVGAFVEYSEKSDAYIEVFKDYVIEEKEYISIFELPIKLEGELVELKSSFENADFKFENSDENSIVTNSTEKIKFADVDESIEITGELNEYLIKYFETNNLNPEIGYDLECGYTADINGDGKEDKIYVLSSAERDLYYMDEIFNVIKEYGHFALIVAKINDEFIKIYDYTLPVNTEPEKALDRNNISSVKIVDLDNDNDYECVCSIVMFEHGEYIFTDYINGEVKMVTRNYIGS